MDRSPMALVTGSCLAVGLAIAGCIQPPEAASERATTEIAPPAIAPASSPLAEQTFATVTAVTVTPGDEGTYTFAVTVSSADTGCEQYADWWEVLTPDGELRYRRILAHSHVDEQPFERTGGPVALRPDQTVIVRAHMQPHGYGPQAMQGTAADGFEDVSLPDDFAPEVALLDPQPAGCAF
jgi:hypothetical protein